ncbi:MAG: hypothetical protein OEZ06_09840 [Myxococcales bacterium]|nr:hypothetical protein [Myxococcales bacterium]
MRTTRSPSQQRKQTPKVQILHETAAAPDGVKQTGEAPSAADAPATASASASRGWTAASLWVQSPQWDVFWLLSGLWAPLLILFLYWGLSHSTTNATDSIEFTATVTGVAVLYFPLALLHRISTTYAVLGTPILREELRKEPRHYLHIPLLIVVGSIGLSLCAVFDSMYAFMPGDRGQLWAFFVLAYVMILWEAWHFCAQEFGVLSIYRIRAEQFDKADKRFDRTFTVVLMLGVNGLLYLRFGFSDHCQVLLYGTPLQGCQAGFLTPLGDLAFAAGTLLLGYALLREWRHPHRSLPKLVYYALVGGHSIFLYFLPQALGVFFLTNVVHHWMVAVALFGRVLHRSTTGAPLATRIASALKPLAWLALATLFYLFFGSLEKAGNLAPVPPPNWFQGSSVPAKLLAGLVIGIFFSLNFLHYYYDRCLYRFSHPAIRAKVGPLLLERR